MNIAFATYGDGPPFVWSQNPINCHVQREWEQPLMRAAITAFAAQRMVVRFDTRGAGLSDRDVDDVSLEAMVRDLEAVVERLQLNEFSLLALDSGGLPAIAYAANHPERVSHLVLVNCFASGEERRGSPRARALMQLVEADWEMFTEAPCGSVPWVPLGGGSKRQAEFMRECVTPEILSRMLEAEKQVDLSGLLSQIQAPTLVVRDSGNRSVPMNTGRRLAAGIPNARLYEAEGISRDNFVQFGRTVFEFLGLGEVPPEVERDAALAAASLDEPGDQPSLDSGAVHTILFTDVEGSTALTDRLGDTEARDLLREHERVVREALMAHGGSEVKTMGDGFMASFGSVTKAVECAVALQREFAEREGEPLNVRVGLRFRERLNRLNTEFSSVLAQFNPPRFQGAEDVSFVDPDRYLPVLYGRRFDQLSSQGLKVMVNVAHAIAHQRTALAEGGDIPLPNILFIDGLTSNIGHREGLDRERVEGIYRYLIGLSEEFADRLQIIVADNDVPQLAEHFIMAEFSEDDRLVPIG